VNHLEDKSGQGSLEGGESRGSISEAGALFDALKNGATSRAKQEAAAARSLTAPGRLFLGLTIGAALLAAATMIYGAYMFPDAPITAVGDRFAGKTGAPKSQDDFERFMTWKKTLFGVFGAVLAFAIAFAFTESRRRRFGRR
jgi:hypothetical protein